MGAFFLTQTKRALTQKCSAIYLEGDLGSGKACKRKLSCLASSRPPTWGPSYLIPTIREVVNQE